MGHITISKNFTSGAVYATLSTGVTHTSTVLNVSKFNHIIFYASGDTGAAGFTGSLTVEASPDGTNFFAYTGFQSHTNTADTLSSGITVSTASSQTFTLRDIGAIHSLRFEMDISNVNASTTVEVLFSARHEDS